MSRIPTERPEHSIAVIGMSCRFPGAENIEEYWNNLRDGQESIRHFSEDELRGSKIPEIVIHDPNYVKSRGIIKDIELFDPAFFGLSPRQARILDPQQRVWLECVHEALEDAGFNGRNPEEIVGVFAGARESTYLFNNLCRDRETQEKLLSLANLDAHQVFLHNDRDSLATRTSYLFNFTGPSVNIQSACSTSLVAVAQACWSLANYQCDTSIAGGVCVTVPNIRGYFYQEQGIYSSDGHCRAFDSQANGTVFSDGVGVVILKRLDDALRDGCRIDAIIRGWAVNNDGREKASFTAPSVNGQAAVIALAQAMASIEAAQVGYVEAHGTGTQIGDPIEVAGLMKAFRNSHTPRFCGLGSVKTNIGHLDTAAGIAGFIKTALALKHQQIPPNLHFKTPNPQINFLDSPFYIVDRLQQWQSNHGPRIAGVSSFGVGGTNCHVVLEEAPERDAPNPRDEHAILLTLSAKTKSALLDLSTRFHQYLSHNTQIPLSDLAVTTNSGRSHYDFRLGVAGDSIHNLSKKLELRIQDPALSHISPINQGKTPEIAFMFTGQGVQYVQMARQLYDTEPEFRCWLERCDQILLPHLERPLLSILYSDGASQALLNRTDYTQPTLFAVEYALAQLWRSWGIEPSWVIGHSVGEYVAASFAGVVSLEDGLRLVSERGRLMNALPHSGKMIAVFTNPDEVAEALKPYNGRVSIAAINTPNHVVISGASQSVKTVVEHFQKKRIHCRELQVYQAFHSPLIEPALAPLERCVEELKLQPPRIGVISNLTGASAGNELTTGAYWRSHSQFPVLFAKGLTELERMGCQVYIEIGPHAVLTRFGQETSSDPDSLWLPSLQRNTTNWHSLSEAMGKLYERGMNINWTAFNRSKRGQPIRLPTYPFQHEPFWAENDSNGATGRTLRPFLDSNAMNPMLGQRLRLPGSDEIRFETHYSRFSPQYLKDHRLFGNLVVPGASHVAMLLQSAENTFGPHACRFKEIVFLRPMHLNEETTQCVQLVFSPEMAGIERNLQLLSTDESTETIDSTTWILHLTGRGKPLTGDARQPRYGSADIDAIQSRAIQTLSGEDFYNNIWGNTSGTGNDFKWIRSIWKTEEEAIAKAERPASADDGLYYRLHPGLFEAAFQVLHCCKTFETAETITRDGVIYVPFSIDELSYYTTNANIHEAWCFAKLRDFDQDNVVADLFLSDQSGQIFVEMIGLCLRKLSQARVTQQQSYASKDHGTGAWQELLSSTDISQGLITHFAREGPTQAPIEDLKARLLIYIQQQAAHISGHPKSTFDRDSSLIIKGFDSLMAIMLSNKIKSDLGLTLSIKQLLSRKSIRILCDELLEEWQRQTRLDGNN